MHVDLTMKKAILKSFHLLPFLIKHLLKYMSDKCLNTQIQAVKLMSDVFMSPLDGA